METLRRFWKRIVLVFVVSLFVLISDTFVDSAEWGQIKRFLAVLVVVVGFIDAVIGIFKHSPTSPERGEDGEQKPLAPRRVSLNPEGQEEMLIKALEQGKDVYERFISVKDRQTAINTVVRFLLGELGEAPEDVRARALDGLIQTTSSVDSARMRCLVERLTAAFHNASEQRAASALALWKLRGYSIPAPIVVQSGLTLGLRQLPVAVRQAAPRAVIQLIMVAVLLVSLLFSREIRSQIRDWIVSPVVWEKRVVVPAGEFIMGKGKEAHEVYVDAFEIDPYEVTNRQYKRFIDAQPDRDPPPYWWERTYPAGREKHPVIQVTWFDARDYCLWLAEKKGRPYRLPTEAEWEKAASWDEDGNKGCRYSKCTWPWGDTFDEDKANTLEGGGLEGGGGRDTTRAGQYSLKGGDSAYGASDMAGNVWEWTSSLYIDYPYDSNDGREDPAALGARVLRGGSWKDSQDFADVTFRRELAPDSSSLSIGFRCVAK